MQSCWARARWRQSGVPDGDASLNWASISGLLLMALWCPALVVSLRRFDLLMDRDQPRASLQGLAFAWFLITLVGRCIALPLVGSILFFQGWRLDPILQFGLGLLVWGTIVESIPSIRADHLALQQRSARNAQQSSRQQALEHRLRDRIWPWAVAQTFVPFAGIYYAITRRTITPLCWEIITRIVFFAISIGITAMTATLIFPVNPESIAQYGASDSDVFNLWMQGFVALLLTILNVVAVCLAIKVYMRRAQADVMPVAVWMLIARGYRLWSQS